MIDVSLLKTLFDDDAMIRKYLLVFRSDVPMSLDELKESIKNMDWDNASITAHSLKSQLQYLKEDEISKLAYEIERRCEEPHGNDAIELQELIDKINLEIIHIFSKIDRYLVEK
ncbi:MAG TPA: Hpt domain-containing protein [Saprospiraceae bacterium]|nr:Hpt domain-containing protein [Saprospiraceae bacterium]HMU06074.1 Hpt domain-containing protein [Saprospiraceae bacterium]